jgi:aspartyl aminopeptidase
MAMAAVAGEGMMKPEGDALRAQAAAEMGKGKEVAQRMVDFINASPSAFHATATCVQRLEANGFEKLSEREIWTPKLKAGGKYYFTRNNSSIVAFAIGGKYQPQNGFKIIGAHTDSPNLQVKPTSACGAAGFQQVSVATYGGGLWHTWFDRDLTVAGRVVVRLPDGSLETQLVNIEKPILKVPNIAIHLQSAEERLAFKIQKENHICPILCTAVAARLQGHDDRGPGKHHNVLMDALALKLGCNPADIVDFELSLSDTQPATVGGLFGEFVFSPRIDNLASCFCALEAMVTAPDLEDDTQCRAIVLFDNEEVGSESYSGAGCTHLTTLVNRLTTDFGSGERHVEDHDIALAHSLIFSADGAHAVHPNYMEKHHALHRPEMHKGVVLKFNVNQRYATSSVTASVVREMARRHNIPLQDFSVGNDTPCGSTIGPITATRLGVKTIDMGIAQLSMHSIREMCGTMDILHMCQLFNVFFTEFHKMRLNDNE